MRYTTRNNAVSEAPTLTCHSMHSVQPWLRSLQRKRAATTAHEAVETIQASYLSLYDVCKREVQRRHVLEPPPSHAACNERGRMVPPSSNGWGTLPIILIVDAKTEYTDEKREPRAWSSRFK